MPETKQTKIVREYCELHPRMGNRTLARLILKDNPEMAKHPDDRERSVDCMRSCVRQLRGLCGDKHRENQNRVPKLDTEDCKVHPFVLVFDIETTPMLSYHWRTYKENISPVQVQKYSKVLCWAAKWLHSDTILFERQMPRDKGDDKRICQKLWDLCDQADVLVAHNGQAFDISFMRSRWLKHGLVPPAPSKMVDTLKIARKQFGFPDNKLETLVRYLEIGGKLHHHGFQMWLDCMAMKPDSWKIMQEYNLRDVVILEAFYEKIRAWDTRAPNLALLYEDADDKRRCMVCGHPKLTAMPGHHAMTSVSLFKVFRCLKCGKVQRVGKREKLEKDILRNVI
jgi:hypothetical protein